MNQCRLWIVVSQCDLRPRDTAGGFVNHAIMPRYRPSTGRASPMERTTIQSQKNHSDSPALHTAPTLHQRPHFSLPRRTAYQETKQEKTNWKQFFSPKLLLRENRVALSEMKSLSSSPLSPWPPLTQIIFSLVIYFYSLWFLYPFMSI